MPQQKGFIKSLFDISFTSFVTPRVVKFLYIVTLVILAIAYVGIAIAIFSGGDSGVQMDYNGNAYESGGGGNAGFGVFWLLVLGPLMFILYTLIYRVFFELVIVIFRIYQNSSERLAIARELNPEAAARVAAAGHPHQQVAEAAQQPPPAPPAPPPTAPPTPPGPGEAGQ